jgi:hypothetical protein
VSFFFAAAANAYARPAEHELRELTVAVSVPNFKKACGRSLPRLLAEELERFGVRSIYGKPVAVAKREMLARSNAPQALAEIGRFLGAEYVLHVRTGGKRSACRARAELIEVAGVNVAWSKETTYASSDPESAALQLAGRAMLDLFGSVLATPVQEAVVAPAPRRVVKPEPAVEEASITEAKMLRSRSDREVFAAQPVLDEEDASVATNSPVERPTAIAKSASLESASPVAEENSMSISGGQLGISDAELGVNISGELTPPEPPPEEPSPFQLRGLLSVANTLEHQPPLDQIDYQRRRGQAFAVFRGMARLEAGAGVDLEAHVLQTLSISTAGGGPFAIADRRIDANRFAGADYAWASGDNANASIIVDRLKFHLTLPSVDISLGRQPINLATTFYFTPNDFFAPFSADTTYRVYKPGVDAARIDVQLGELSTLSVIGALGYEHAPLKKPLAEDPVTWDRSALLLTSSFSVSTFHFTALAGKIPSALAVGGAVEGELFDWLGVRMEGHYAIPSLGRRNRLELAIAAEHRFESSLHLRVEHFIHGSGAAVRDAFQAAIDENLGTIPFLSVNLTAFGAGYEITPLLAIETLMILSWTDRSGLASISARYSIFENGEVAASARVPWGRAPDTTIDEQGFIHPSPASEFGMYPLGGNVDFRIFF